MEFFKTLFAYFLFGSLAFIGLCAIVIPVWLRILQLITKLIFVKEKNYD